MTTMFQKLYKEPTPSWEYGEVLALDGSNTKAQVKLQNGLTLWLSYVDVNLSVGDTVAVARGALRFIVKRFPDDFPAQETLIVV